MSLWQKTKLIAGFIQAAFTKLTPEDIEKLKSGGLMSELIQEMSRVYPSLAKHILHERDLYLTSTLVRIRLNSKLIAQLSVL
jgi:pheromone shutdown protein TraB